MPAALFAGLAVQLSTLAILELIGDVLLWVTGNQSFVAFP
jgi:hypothetical protein